MTRYDEYSREDLLDRIEELEDETLSLLDQIEELKGVHQQKQWIEDFVDDVKSYLDWRQSPNAALSKSSQQSVEYTMLSSPNTKMAEVK